MRPDGRIGIPKDTREAGDIHPGDLLQIIIKKYKSCSVEIEDP